MGPIVHFFRRIREQTIFNEKNGYFDQMAGKEILQLFVQNGCISPLLSEGNDVPLRKENRKMLDVRNSDGRLVCQVNEKTGAVEIKTKNCKTIIKPKPDSMPEITNTRI